MRRSDLQCCTSSTLCCTCLSDCCIVPCTVAAAGQPGCHVTDPSLLLLQSPVLSACWCVGLCQIMIPVITFSRDTTPFCKSVSIAEAALFLIYSTFAFLCNLLGPNFFDRAEMFGFYNFPFSYTSWHDLMVWAFLAVYIVVLPYTRKLLDAHEQRKSNKVMPSET